MRAILSFIALVCIVWLILMMTNMPQAFYRTYKVKKSQIAEDFKKIDKELGDKE